MKVILLKSVQKVGQKDTIVEVSDGYAAHALFPKKLAIPATPKAIEALSRKKNGEASERAMHHNLLDAAIKNLQELTVIFPAKKNEQGHLFAKVSAKDIAHFLETSHRISIDPGLLVVTGGHIKEVGVYMIEVKDKEYTSSFPLTIA